ncbi:MAG: alpha-L-fucosidase [Firmicutes bacterium]|nr:alpha-L-fucosidase [Bacillota bacterium]
MSAIVPKKEQLEFLSWEIGAFFHFGIRTFYEGHKDWDMKEMPLSGFDPRGLDCQQWTETVRKAGARYAVLVCKHHDGFANWPSRYTDYSVANTPWKNGKGDVVREFTEACRASGLKTGLYYSPAEFGSNARDAKDYDEYFINQISELLTGYGKIDYLWFDGCGSENHQYDTGRIVSVIRRLQPGILIFNMWDPDTRWVGNESGYAHMPNLPVVGALSFSVFTETKDEIGAERFLPVECDFRMRRHNWFYSDRDEDTVKSLDELVGIYYYTVGRGANMLLNIGPDRNGLLPEKDARRFIEFGEEIRRRFSDPVGEGLEKNGNAYTVAFKEPTLVNHAVLREKVDAVNYAKRFSVKAYPYEYGEPVTVYLGGTVGHKAVCQFPAFFTKKIEVVVEEAAGEPRFDEILTYFIK